MADVPLPEPDGRVWVGGWVQQGWIGKSMHAHAAAVSAAKDAEIAQLRQYLDTAQRRAAALGDEVAGLREAQIDYTVLHGFADKHRISYNELCVAVRAALAARKGTT